MQFPSTRHGLTALAFALAAAAAAAQTPAPKAADGKTLSGASASGTSKLLTRDELRACLAQQKTINTRQADHAGQRAQLTQEKAGITAEQQALKAERDAVQRQRGAADDLADRMKAFGAKAAVWTKRAADFAEGKRSDPAADKERAELDAERLVLQKERELLEGERNALMAAVNEAVNKFNLRATTLDKTVDDWNARSAQLDKVGQAFDDDRQTWVADCGDRRYREDDEAAIRRGQ